MKRTFRRMQSCVAALLLLIAGIWLGVPRDICLTKAFVDADCSCILETAVEPGCGCCESAKAGRTLPCGDAETAGKSGPLKHSSKCIMVSSELAKVTGAERVVDHVVPNLDVLCVLPFHSELLTDGINALRIERNQHFSLCTDTFIRNSCVLLI